MKNRLAYASFLKFSFVSGGEESWTHPSLTVVNRRIIPHRINFSRHSIRGWSPSPHTHGTHPTLDATAHTLFLGRINLRFSSSVYRCSLTSDLLIYLTRSILSSCIAAQRESRDTLSACPRDAQFIGINFCPCPNLMMCLLIVFYTFFIRSSFPHAWMRCLLLLVG